MPSIKKETPIYHQSETFPWWEAIFGYFMSARIHEGTLEQIKVTPWKLPSTGSIEAGIQFTQVYNSVGKKEYQIKTRDNVTYHITSRPSRQPAGLYITTVLSMPMMDYLSMKNASFREVAVDECPSETAKALFADDKRKAEVTTDSLYGPRKGATVTFFIPEESITNDAAHYFQELDILVGTSDMDLPKHPSVGVSLNWHPYNEEDVSGFEFKVRYIDNEGASKPKYLFCANQVYKLYPQKSPKLKTGFYVTSPPPFHQDNAHGTKVTRMYPLEKAAELGFFNTVEEAMTLGKPDLVLESKRSEAARMKSDNELKKLQFELEAMKSKQQINEETHKATIEEMRITSEKREEELRATTNKYKAELDQKQRLLEIEKEKALAKLTTEQEHARIKMDYESRSLDRKDTSDVLKYLPSLILGVGAAVVAFSSFLG